MDTTVIGTHLRIWLYDVEPPPGEPVEQSLCIPARDLAVPLSDVDADVTCPDCLRIMAELLL